MEIRFSRKIDENLYAVSDLLTRDQIRNYYRFAILISIGSAFCFAIFFLELFSIAVFWNSFFCIGFCLFILSVIFASQGKKASTERRKKLAAYIAQNRNKTQEYIISDQHISMTDPQSRYELNWDALDSYSFKKDYLLLYIRGNSSPSFYFRQDELSPDDFAALTAFVRKILIMKENE